mmetsp:Transcript_66134/g.147648  ORF Transcript_66134/g.147648 Transcript_66134/m.147648 type:complete len:159 (-) Transcript_66134:768-1244(-)
MPTVSAGTDEVDANLASLKIEGNSGKEESDEDEEEDGEIEEDGRISQLYSFAEKHAQSEPARFVEYLDELGVAHAIVLGGLCTDAETARAHFVAQSLLDADEDQTLAQCIEAKHGALKASCVGGGAVREAAFLAALESFATHLDEEDGCREVRGQGLW